MLRAFNSVGVFLLAGLVFFGTERPAKAQFFPTWRPSPFAPPIPIGSFTTPWGSFSFGQAQYLSLYRTLPTGQTFSFSYYSYQAGLPLLNNYFVQPVYTSGVNPNLYGGFSSLTGNTYNPTLTRMQQDLGAAQRAMSSGSIGGSTESAADLNRWANSRIEGANKENDPAKAIDVLLINPPEENILNGSVLNELAVRILALEKAGKRSSSALCPPALISKIVFDGGPPADAVNVFRDVALSFPTLLMGTEYADARTDLQDAFSPVFTTVQTGKRVDNTTAEKLLVTIRKAKDAASILVKSAEVKDSAAVSRFFNQLEGAAKFLKEPNSIGIIGAKWNTVGSNVSELVQHMAKHKLKFGRVATDDEVAYYSLHRAMLSYYANLSQAR